MTDHFPDPIRYLEPVFRSDHASNWLALKGMLNADKSRLLEQLDQAMVNPDCAPLRPGWARGF